MKKVITVLIAFVNIVNYSCKEKIDFGKEKEAIMAVIKEETAAYYASDFERWCTFYLQDSTAVYTLESKSGFSILSGWDSILPIWKPQVLNKKEVRKQVKTPIRIKIYGETAWILYDNETLNGELTGEQFITYFLEKHDGTWKIVYRNSIQASTYSNPDPYILNSINYAKSLGKSVEDLAGFTGDQYKKSWNQASGYNGFVNSILSFWRSVVPIGKLKIQEQDNNHLIFSVSKMLAGLKAGPQYNVTYDDYLTFYRVICEKAADYMGAIYMQETTPDGVLVTITKK